MDKAKELLSQNAEAVGQAIDKAGEFVDEKTQGKYTDTIHQVQQQAKKVAGSEDKGDQQS
jgi:hypothetical protein